jgi:hypothetical protein
MSKVQLSGNVNGTGIFTIASPNSNTDRTLTLPDNTGTILTGSSAITTSQLPAGSVLQVVEGKLSTSFSTTSTSPVDTGLSAAITPTSSSNKILCFVTLNGLRADNTTYNIYLYLNRNGTLLDSVSQASSFFTYFASTQLNGRIGTVSNMILDTPSTTSALTYKVQIASEFGTSTSFINNQNSMLTVSTLVLMEIAA